MSDPKDEKKFKDDPVTPMWRHWLCGKDGCAGEMKSTGRGFTTMDTDWEHRCDKCAREDWAKASYPKIVYL